MIGELRGHPLDPQTRCVHWHGPLDVVAFRFACCDGWWPCHDCHDETAGHKAMPWPKSRHAQPSVICGVCRHEMTVAEYVGCNSRCPVCRAGFNPACKGHWPRYFE
ncbi:MAG: CHY zinc finger protein [bacterium]